MLFNINKLAGKGSKSHQLLMNLSDSKEYVLKLNARTLFARDKEILFAHDLYLILRT